MARHKKGAARVPSVPRLDFDPHARRTAAALNATVRDWDISYSLSGRTYIAIALGPVSDGPRILRAASAEDLVSAMRQAHGLPVHGEASQTHVDQHG